MARQSIKDRPKREEKFKAWVINRKEGNSQGTANTYWTQIKDIPDFNIVEEPIRLIRTRIKGAVSDPHKLSSIRQFLEYQYEHHNQKIREGKYELSYILQHFDHEELLRGTGHSPSTNLEKSLEADEIDEEDVRDIAGDILETRKDQIRNIDLDNSEKGGRKMPNIKNHFIPKEEFVKLLKDANSRRAKFWLLTYLLGARYGEVKRIQWSDVNLDYGDHGKLDIPDEKSKSKDERQVLFHSELAPMLLRDIFGIDDSLGIYGDWTDSNDTTWEDVCFPEIKQSKVNYELGKEFGKGGDVSQYGLLFEATDLDSPRTMHSLRHTRITDLIKGDGRKVEYAGDRSGHADYSTTQHYTETTFTEPPKSLERYIDEKFDGDYRRFLKEVVGGQCGA